MITMTGLMVVVNVAVGARHIIMWLSEQVLVDSVLCSVEVPELGVSQQ